MAHMYYLAVESTSEAITWWDKNLKLLFANPAFVTQAGVPLSQLVGKTIREMGHPELLAPPWIKKCN
ncbi:PAS domain-containing protein [Adhaeribacter arboris]|nr:PAS domain-containing protein [Adhaeribacter arboris]